jgi:hypothetical protein
MADENIDLRLAIIAAGILASDELRIGPAEPKEGGGVVMLEQPDDQAWAVYADRLRVSGSMKNHPGLMALEALSKDIYKRLYGDGSSKT